MSINRKLGDLANVLDDGTEGQVLSFNASGAIAASTISTESTLGTLTQSFDSNQTSSIALSSAVNTVPYVSVFKEVPQAGISSKGQWDVNSNATNYDFYDEKPISYASTTLTPSATGDGTFTSSTATSSTYDISSLSLNNTFDISTVSVTANGVWFKSDGTVMYIHDNQVDTIIQYPLSTAWDLSTVGSTTGNVAVGSQDTNIRGPAFSADGTKMYTVGYMNDRFYQYTLSTAWDVTTASYSNKSVSFASADAASSIMHWKSDGTSFFNTGSVNDRVYRWDLTTAWDISTASNVSNFDISSVFNTPYGISLNSDGTKMFIMGGTVNSNYELRQYSLSTAYDITTATYDSVLWDWVSDGSQSGSADGHVFFGSSGTRLYLVRSANNVTEWISGSTTAFSSTDVGKKVVGNSGSAIITATSGAYTSVTPFADTSAISSWQLFGAQGKADGSGIELTSTTRGYDFSNLSYTGRSFYLTGAVATLVQAEGMAMKPDGTKMWVAGRYLDKIVEFSLSTPYKIDTASSTGTTLDILSYESSVTGLYVNSEGTRLIIIGSNQDEWNEFHLSTGWDLTTATHDQVRSIADLTTGVSAPQDLVFNDDGTRLFICDDNNDAIFGYTLSTAFDINTLTSAGSLSLASIETAPGSLNINNDGTELYISGSQNDNLQMLKLDTAYDLSSYNASASLTYSWTSDGLGTTPIEGITISKSGSKLYLTSNAEYIYEYDFGALGAGNFNSYSPALTNSSTGQINSSSWLDINSMTADETKNDGDIFYAVSTDNRASWAVAKGSDGVRKIARNNSGTWQYNNNAGSSVTAYYDIVNAVYDSVSYTPSNPVFSSVMAVGFSADGTKMYTIVTGVPWQHELSTAFDISTASSIGYNYTADLPEGNARLITFNPTGTKMYIGGIVDDTIYQYSLSNAFDLAGSSVSRDTNKTFAITNASGVSTVNLNGMIFNNNGTKMYVINNDRIEQYSLSTAYDISTASYDSINFVVTSQETVANDIKFNSDGTKLFLVGNGSDAVQQYSLSTAYDLSTISYDSISFSVLGNVSNARSLNFNNDGSKMYVSTLSGGTVYQYTTSGSNTVYVTSETWVNGANNNEHATLQEALTSQSFNRMNKAQLDAVADGYHFSQDSADTLDLMIAPYATSGTSPISDGVTINYDAASKYKQAINGTEYDVEFTTLSSIDLTSKISANLKVRVL